MQASMLEFFQTLLDYLPELMNGLHTSLLLTAASLVMAFGLSILLTVILTLKTPFIYWLTKGYITLFTGTPLLIQIYLIYYGPGQFQFIQNDYPLLWQLMSNVWFCAILALTLNSAAYTTLLFHGAVKAIPEGQWQSCEALGMSKTQTLRILLPYALKRALSSYSNEVVLVFKSTSLAYTITLMEVMGYTKRIFGNNYDLSVFITAGIIYLTINSLLILAMRLIEKKALAFEKR
jgi:arginine transport system permease protein